MSRLRWQAVAGGVLAAVLVLGSRPAKADPTGVGLGVGLGLAVPSGQVVDSGGNITKLKPNFAWGFYVNIPLIATFHLTPHAELYKVADKVTATDLGMAFKFVINTPMIKPYVGLDVGDTNVTSGQQLNVGGLAGATVHLVANVDAFLEARYVYVLRDQTEGGNITTVHAIVGGLFRF